MIKFLKILILILIILSMFFIVFKVNIVKKMSEKQTTLKIGIAKGQKEYFTSKLSESIAFENLMRKGKSLIQQGEYSKAINYYNEIFSMAKWQGDKARIMLRLADIYEKKRDYKKSLEYVIIDRDEYVSDEAKKPIAERAKYLEYASQGNYERAVKYAQLALEADAELPSRPKTGRQQYIDRLSDLKSSKKYIESLKEANAL